MTRLTYSQLGGAAVCFSALAVAVLYLEKYLLLAPCPLCILDRIAAALMGILFLAGALAAGKKTKMVLWAANIAALAGGLVFAGRHIWLQHRPPVDDAACLSDSAPARALIDIVGQAFDADADCGAVYWEFWGLTIPEQVLLLFIGLAVLLAVQGAWIAKL